MLTLPPERGSVSRSSRRCLCTFHSTMCSRLTAAAAAHRAALRGVGGSQDAAVQARGLDSFLVLFSFSFAFLRWKCPIREWGLPLALSRVPRRRGGCQKCPN